MRIQELERSVYEVSLSPLYVFGSGEPRELRPAAESIWYVLATIAGEPARSSDPAVVVEQNRMYWNSFIGGE